MRVIKTPNEQLSTMIVLAAQRHEGQFDKGGLLTFDLPETKLPPR